MNSEPRISDNEDISPVPKMHFHVNSLHQALLLQEKGTLPNPINTDTVITISPPSTPPDTRFLPERRKTALALCFMLINLIGNLTVLSYIHDRVPDRDTNPPLPDVVFSLIPVFEKGLDISEVLLSLLSWLVLIIIVFHKHRFIVFRRLFFILGLLYFWRSITMFVTQMPVASLTYVCSPKLNSTSPSIIAGRVWQLFKGMGLSINGNHVYCGDYIYSGHTIVFTIAYLSIKEYAPNWCKPLNIFIGLLSFVGVTLIVIARGHYTIDVLISYYITTRIFWHYHTMANTPLLKVQSHNNYLANVWWFKIFLYLEKNVLETVPKEYSCPIRIPQCIRQLHPISSFNRYRISENREEHSYGNNETNVERV